jgi:monovalent cation/hydrogen antiporter
MEYLEITLGLLCAVAALGVVAKTLPVPLPILQVAGGALLSLLPMFQHARVEPSVFFALFIPPLLFSDGWLIPKRDFARVMRPVLLLALGLVVLTVLAVGYLVHFLIPSVPLAAAFALGAIVSPTDAVALSAITQRLKLPSRVIHIVDGESLINDASGLVAFKFSVAAVLTGTFSLPDAMLNFLLLSGGGIATGFAVAWSIGAMRVGLLKGNISEPMVQTTLSLLTPFAAYFAAEYLQVSGILSVVVAGLYAGLHDTRNLTTETRLQTHQVWSMLLFVFNGLVFVLLGLQLPSVLSGLDGHPWIELLGQALLVYAVVTVARIAWVYPSAYLPLLFSKRIRRREGLPRPANVFIVGWAGIRGAVTLAAALSLPFTGAGEHPFPARDLLIFLAGSVIVISLVVNGLTLPALIRWLNISGDGIAEREEHEARIAVAQAAIERIRAHTGPLSSPHEQAFALHLIASYERSVEHLLAEEDARADVATELKVENNIRLIALAAAREELARLHRTRAINEEVLRTVEREIDYRESSILASSI